MYFLNILYYNMISQGPFVCTVFFSDLFILFLQNAENEMLYVYLIF